MYEDLEDLKRISLFQLLTTAEITAVAGIIEEVFYEAGSSVCRENEQGDALYIVKTGAVRIIAAEKEINLLHEGDFFGEIALFERVPRTATAIAVEDSVFLRITRDNFASFISKNPYIGIKVLFRMIQDLSRRLRNITTQAAGNS